MADAADDSKTSADKKLTVPRTALEIQRMQYDKLMRDPDKPVNIPQRRKDRELNAPPEFVRFVMGSSAGAGSGEFHVYRSTRRRENNRVEHIERVAKTQELETVYHNKLEENKNKAEERTAKKRAKRQKKSQAKKRKQLEQKGTENTELAVKSSENNPDSDSGHEEEEEEEEEEDEEEEEEEEEEDPHFIVGGK